MRYNIGAVGLNRWCAKNPPKKEIDLGDRLTEEETAIEFDWDAEKDLSNAFSASDFRSL